MSRIRLAAALAAGVLVLAACGDDEAATTTTTTTTIIDHGHDADFAFGEPGDAAAADRVIELVTNDVLRFEPDTFDVALGETITFRVTNDSPVIHDFTLGDLETQEEHAAAMAQMGAAAATMPDEPNAFVLDVGETKELTWTFSVAGAVLIGCHQPGHYDAGMVATIRVRG
ncbi:MAG: copper-binding protein [Acidimicrobiia bacterium]|nr:copper-binding protein [Acidimicrobiia bacterium]